MGSLKLIALNSSYCCSPTGSADDHGKLVIANGAWESAISTINDGTVVLTAMHHPLSYLTEPSSRLLEPKLTKHSRAHLSGHLHSPAPALSRTPRGETIFLQSGALYARSENFKGYCLFSIDDEGNHRRVQYRTYQDVREEFDDGINVCPRGLFFPSTDDEHFWNEKKPTELADVLICAIGLRPI